MFGLGKLTTAFSNLAASINGLAAVVDAASGKLRQHLALEDHAAPLAPVVIEHTPAPAEPAAAEESSVNGRRRKASVA
jgi:hypothetical protein